MHIARLAARTVIGGLFVGHGTQKLFGWFDGPGLQGTAGFMQALELRPAKPHAVAAGAAETIGGTLLALGLATPLGASSLIGTMIVAIRKVHLPKGPWVSNGGYEYNLVLIAAVAALVEAGPGELSLDHLLGIERKGPAWALAVVGAGAVGSTLIIESAKHRPAPVAEPGGNEAAAPVNLDHATADQP
jgi:putative oxidoreductase